MKSSAEVFLNSPCAHFTMFLEDCSHACVCTLQANNEARRRRTAARIVARNGARHGGNGRPKLPEIVFDWVSPVSARLCLSSSAPFRAPFRATILAPVTSEGPVTGATSH